METHHIIRLILVLGTWLCIATGVLYLRPRLNLEMMRVNGYRELRRYIQYASWSFCLLLIAGVWFHIRYFDVPFDLWDGIIYSAYMAGGLLTTWFTIKVFTFKVHE